MRVGVLQGGTSQEAEASKWTARFVVPALQRLGHDVWHVDPSVVVPNWRECDVWFNCLHGGEGEDGTIQSALDQAGVPYTGSGPQASAVCMDKLLFKSVARSLSIPCPQEWQGGDKPAMLKPRWGGGSIGMHVLDTESAASIGATLGEDYLMEEFIAGTSVTVGLLETARGLNVLPPVAIELASGRLFYDRASKYEEDMVELTLFDSADSNVNKALAEASASMYQKLCCSGYSRFDFIVAGSEWSMLEANTLPGIYPGSNFCFAAEMIGISFDNVVDQILNSSTMPPLNESHQHKVLKW